MERNYGEERKNRDVEGNIVFALIGDLCYTLNIIVIMRTHAQCIQAAKRK